MADPRFFRSTREFGRWLASNHGSATEIWVGFHKKHVAAKGMTYLEAVEEALCWGWIDGQVRGRDADSFQQRFTPRTSRSTWSLINIARVERLIAEGRMRPPGAAAFAARVATRTGIYSFEQRSVVLPAGFARKFRSARAAWAWFSTQAPSYRRVAIHWVTSAKQLATRERRLAALIAESAKGLRLRQFTPRAARAR